MITLRDYQQESIEAVFAYWKQSGGNPLIELATGLGKSLVVAEMAKRILRDYPTMRIMMLVHVRELVRQNYEELLKVWPDAPVGVYSAGLGQRDTHHRIIYASIQSVYKRAKSFTPRQLVLIDEAHLVPGKGEGMYRTFLEGLREHCSSLRVAGLTATPYRLDSGRLDEGEDRMFDKIVCEYGIGPGTEDGYLAPLTARVGQVEISVEGVAKRGGEFVSGALNFAANKDDVVDRACDDIVARGQDRRSWLAFCSGVDHAERIAAGLRARGVTAATVTGNTPKHDRDRMIADFKAGRIRALTNANVLTAGFNAPRCDLIAMLRPTLSTGLYVQMMGRGTRTSGVNLQAYNTAAERTAAIANSEKPNCLVLDYAGNVRRHGPVDAIHVDSREERKTDDEEVVGRVEVGEVRAKECPECGAIAAINARKCEDCGHEYGEPKHEAQPEDIAIMTREVEQVFTPVMDWHATKHLKYGNKDGTPTVKVTIFAGVQGTSEWVCFEHQGFAGRKAGEWWALHGGELPTPATVDEALERWDEVNRPEAITRVHDGKYYRIGKRRFGATQERLI